jgi:hypothetical protein
VVGLPFTVRPYLFFDCKFIQFREHFMTVRIGIHLKVDLPDDPFAANNIKHLSLFPIPGLWLTAWFLEYRGGVSV